MTDSPPARRLSDKIKAAWQQAMDLGRDEIADRLGLLYEATVQHETERFPRRRRQETDVHPTKLSTPEDVRTPAAGNSAESQEKDKG